MRYEKIVECIDWKVADTHAILLKTIPLYDNSQKDYRYYLIKTDIDNECEYTVGQKIQADLHDNILNCFSCDKIQYREAIDKLLNTDIPDSIELLHWLYYAEFRQIYFCLKRSSVLLLETEKVWYKKTIDSNVINIEQYINNELETLVEEIKQPNNIDLINNRYSEYKIDGYTVTLKKICKGGESETVFN